MVARFDEGQPPSLPLPLPFTPLAGGTDGEAIAAADYLGDDGVPPEQRIGLAGLAAVDEISLLCVPDDVTFPELQADVLAECERQMDRFAILQVGAGQTDPAYVTAPSASSYGAIYHPWLRVPDAATEIPVPRSRRVATSPGSTRRTTSNGACTRRRRTSSCGAW